ncbi:uncharacterized protein LOC112637206 [Camponotus floridanus]|uniref:uncharacterized protein LOC112637206 n=1 Tax=Camponotus floridanus TaxID=104421 RepID=UPI000DC6BC8D|nr:uncharacterized protein LOC112637206 [Camponotus floridanus]
MMKFELRRIAEMITNLSLNLSDKQEVIPMKQNEKPPDDNILPVFPLQNWQHFCDLENLLHSNEVANRQLEKMLFKRGGRDPSEFIRRILSKLFSNELAVRVSWLGRKQNKRLEGTIVARTIFAVIKLRYKNYDDRDIETKIIDWFRRANDRIPKNRNIND